MHKVENVDRDKYLCALHARSVFCLTFIYMWQWKSYETVFLQCKNCSEDGASRGKTSKLIVKNNICKTLEGDGEELEGKKFGKKEVKRKKEEEDV